MIAMLLLLALQIPASDIPTVKEQGFTKAEAFEMENILLKDQIIQRDQSSLRTEYSEFKKDVEKAHKGYTVSPDGRLVVIPSPQPAPKGKNGKK